MKPSVPGLLSNSALLILLWRNGNQSASLDLKALGVYPVSVDEIQARLSVSVVARDMDWNSSLLFAKSASEPCILEITEAEGGVFFTRAYRQ